MDLSSWNHRHGDGERKVLTLNVLLLGSKQSGRSSVGNALIGGQEFQTGVAGVSKTTECHLIRRTFPRYFRRQGAESDLMLRVIDTTQLLPHPQSVHKLCSEGVHVVLLVLRADLPHLNTNLEQHVEVNTHTYTLCCMCMDFFDCVYFLCVQTLFGPEWHRHTLLVLTHADHLKKMGLQPSVYLTQMPDSLRALAEKVVGGVSFLDNSCDWPSNRGRPLREQLLRLSARNHHTALAVRTDVSLGL
ncbi:hypothetical protein PAMP_016071 [Pampus punctatissimus]